MLLQPLTTIDLMTTRSLTRYINFVGSVVRTYLSYDLSGDAINPSNAVLRPVVDKSKMRKFIKSADTMRKNAYDGSMDSEQTDAGRKRNFFNSASQLKRRTKNETKTAVPSCHGR